MNQPKRKKRPQYSKRQRAIARAREVKNDEPRRDLMLVDPRGTVNRRPRRYATFAVLPGQTGTSYDPGIAVAHWLRRRLHSARVAELCRVLDPTTGAVVGTIDPITRRFTRVAPVT